jgi:HSP20 family protein
MKMLTKTSPLLPYFWDELLQTPLAGGTRSTGATVPAVNITEEDKAYTLSFAIPGKSKDDFEVEVEDDLLVVRTTTTHEDSSEGPHYTHREYHYGSFQRSFTLPESVAAGKISARYKDGILNIDLPKREEALPAPKKLISVK